MRKKVAVRDAAKFCLNYVCFVEAQQTGVVEGGAGSCIFIGFGCLASLSGWIVCSGTEAQG